MPSTGQKPFDEIPVMVECKLPSTIYSSAALVLLGIRPEQCQNILERGSATVVLPQWFLLITDILVQGGFLFCLRDESESTDACESPTTYFDICLGKPT